MKKNLLLASIMLLFSQFIFAQSTVWPMNGKIRVYFNHPVTTTVSSGTNAVYLNNCIADTLVNYINRAKYTMDCAIYNATYSSTMTPVINAVNAAKARGVTVRWIDNGSSSNSAVSHLSSSINTLSSPTATGYGIMHCKFMIIDANSTNTADPIVWTGSTNWSDEQFNSDYNNVVIIQDQALAQAYTAEFNEMWGSTTATPSSTNAKFGSHKTDPLANHSFSIGGKNVELYFSPTDGTNNHIISTINSANTDLYFGVYTFTLNSDATPIVTKHNAGVYTAGIEDSYSQTYSPYTTLLNGLGSSLFKVFTETSSMIYHNKFVVVDPSNPNSDPQVLTGSHNWSSSANTDNDENTLIIHDATVANMYYQSFYHNFTDLGGTLTIISGVNDITPADGDVYLYPNPAVEGSPVYLNINPELNLADAKLIIYNILGDKLKEFAHLNNQQIAIDCGIQRKGIYFYRLFDGEKLLKAGKILFY